MYWRRGSSSIRPWSTSLGLSHRKEKITFTLALLDHNRWRRDRTNASRRIVAHSDPRWSEKPKLKVFFQLSDNRITLFLKFFEKIKWILIFCVGIFMSCKFKRLLWNLSITLIKMIFVSSYQSDWADKNSKKQISTFKLASLHEFSISDIWGCTV